MQTQHKEAACKYQQRATEWKWWEQFEQCHYNKTTTKPKALIDLLTMNLHLVQTFYVL